MNTETEVGVRGLEVTAKEPNNKYLREKIIEQPSLVFYVGADNDNPDRPYLWGIATGTGTKKVTITVTYENMFAASTATLSQDSVDLDNQTSVNLVITNHCDEGYESAVTHEITWSIAAFNYSNTQIVEATDQTTFNAPGYIPPVSFLSEYMTDTNTAVMNVQLVTKTADIIVYPIQNLYLTLNVPSSLKPTLSELYLTRFHDSLLSTLFFTQRVDDDDIGCVQNHDAVSILTDGAQGIEGSRITDYVFTISGRSYTQHVGAPLESPISYTAYAQQVQQGLAWDHNYCNVYKIPVITSAYDITVTGYVIDSRGQRSTMKTLTIPVTACIQPQINEGSSIRCDAEGTALETGGYARASMAATYSRLTVVARDLVTGQIIYTGEVDDQGNPIPQYRNLNTLEMVAYYGYPTYSPDQVDEDGNPIVTWTWYLEDGTVLGNGTSSVSGSAVIGDGTAAHSTAVLFVANDYFTSEEDFEDQPHLIVFTTSSEYVIFFREGGTGIAFGQALGSNEDNRFVVTESWSMMHGEGYIPTIIVQEGSTPPAIPSVTSHAIWLQPINHDGGWTQCNVYYYYNP